MIDFEKIVDFVDSVFGENRRLANATLREFGIDPTTRRPYSRKELQMIDFEKIVDFVDSVFGKNRRLANATLREFGIDPTTRRPIPIAANRGESGPGDDVDDVDNVDVGYT